MSQRRKRSAPAGKRVSAERYRALVDFSIRDDEDGWLNVKAGEEFTPPKQMNVRQSAEIGTIEVVAKTRAEAQYEPTEEGQPEEVINNE